MEIERYIACEDKELVQLVIDGDDYAFEHLFNRYRDSIQKMYLQKTNGNKEDTNDLLQETCVKIYLNMSKYNSSYTFGQWLYTIARNVFIDHIRKRKDERGFDGISLEEAHLAPNPEERYIRVQQKSQLEYFLSQMSPKYRELIDLRFYKELSYDEIAVKLQLPLGTVKTRIHRAREQLCKFLTENTDMLN